MVIAAAIGFLVAGAGWLAVVTRSRRDLTLSTVALLILAPVVVSVLVGDDKTGIAVAEGAFVPALLAVGLRRSDVVSLTRSLTRNLLAPFALLYLAAGLAGLVWASIRGNGPVLSVGQSSTAAMFVAGFAIAGPLVHSRVSDAGVLILSGVVAAITLPDLVPFSAWVFHPHHAQFMRYLGRAALFAPLLGLLLLASTRRRHPRASMVGFGFFAAATLLTFTRSYWLGFIAGLALVAVATAVNRLGRPLRLAGSRRRMAGALACLAAGLTVFLATPLAHFVVKRTNETTGVTFDPAVVVRKYELTAAWASIRAHPLLGIGAGGRFDSLYQVGDHILYGGTNFIHNAYLYLPLKFGILGFAALLAFLAGLLTALARSLRDAREDGVAAVAFPATLLALAVLSITAPNLVDPRYSVLAGVIAYLAGTRIRPAEPSDRVSVGGETETRQATCTEPAGLSTLIEPGHT